MQSDFYSFSKAGTRVVRPAYLHLLMAATCLLAAVPLAEAVAQSVEPEYGIYVPIGQTRQETRFDCWNITNNSPTGAEVYVPLNARDEWDGPYGIKTRPPEGVTFAPCSSAQIKSQGGPLGGPTSNTATPAGSTSAAPSPTQASTGACPDPSTLPPGSGWVGMAPNAYAGHAGGSTGSTAAYWACMYNGNVLFTSYSNEGCCPGPAAANGTFDPTTLSNANGGGERGYDSNGNATNSGSYNSVSNPSTPTNSQGVSGDPTGGAAPGGDPGGGSPGGGDPGGGSSP